MPGNDVQGQVIQEEAPYSIEGLSQDTIMLEVMKEIYAFEAQGLPLDPYAIAQIVSLEILEKYQAEIGPGYLVIKVREGLAMPRKPMNLVGVEN